MYEITDDYLVMYEITDDFSAHRLHLSGASQKFADVQPIGSTPMSRLHDLVAACATHFLPSVFSSPRFTLLSSHQHPRPRPRRPHASPTFTLALVAHDPIRKENREKSTLAMNPAEIREGGRAFWGCWM